MSIKEGGNGKKKRVRERMREGKRKGKINREGQTQGMEKGDKKGERNMKGSGKPAVIKVLAQNSLLS